MFGELATKLRHIASDKVLRGRILFVLFALFVFRALAAIPIPGIDAQALNDLLSGDFGQLFGLLNIFSGGGLSNLSIVMLGVAPYITASIIMQLSTVMSPKLKAMYQEEGEIGRKKFTQMSRQLTVPLALMQSFGFLKILEQQGVLGTLSTFELVENMLIVTAGSILLMWIGELITEFGIGNGVSLIIFAGIVAGLPTALANFITVFDATQLPATLGFLVVGLLVVAGVVLVSEAERPIPVTYARKARGMKTSAGVSTYLPIRVNQAGVMPIIFALSLLLFPQMLLSFFAPTGTGVLASIANFLNALLSNGWVYAGLYFILVFGFTYFYTAVTFEPHTMAKNLQKSGAFIPGVRPGETTAEYIGNIITRLTLVGALFLGGIAVLPLAMQAVTGITAFTIGGTALLIAVSVILDLVRKIESQLSIREY